MRFVKVAVPVAVEKVFTYLVPPGMEVRDGSVVRVPFRKGKPIGVVVGEAEEFPGAKEISEHIIDLPVSLFRLGMWVSEYYLAYPGEVFQFILPPFRKRFKKEFYKGDKELPPVPTVEQELAINEVLENKKGVFLLHGVTGSGKTEVYFRIMEKVLDAGGSVLYLVPEIGMVPQTLERVRKRFGEGEEYHSKLTPSERMAVWMGCLEGRIKAVVGARMAVFLPMENLGLIVVDEEHDTSYRQSSMRPLYSGRDVAVKRGLIEECPVILGSATPSVESYWKAERGEYKLLTLKSRISGMELPEVEIVNLREREILSEDLINRMKEEKGRIILFLNRRGYSPFVICKNCGFIMKCPYCDIPMTFHKETNRFVCHHCGFIAGKRESCPKCGNPLEFKSLGTEKVEERLKGIFGESLARMDRDSMRKRKEHHKIYRGLKDGSIRVLVGTQMVTKGLDLPDVSLVVVLRADNILNFPDFRASERTFQLLSQVAGRAGRGEKGKVLIQTYFPEHYVIKAAKNHDYIGFYRKEIDFRKKAGYPPFSCLGRVVIEGEDLAKVQETARKVVKGFKGEGVKILGPSICPVKKRAGRFRYHILLKSDRPEKIQGLLKPLLSKKIHKIKIIIEIDPQDIL